MSRRPNETSGDFVKRYNAVFERAFEIAMRNAGVRRYSRAWWNWRDQLYRPFVV